MAKCPELSTSKKQRSDKTEKEEKPEQAKA
jgi:hypothetical protein